MKFAPDEQVSEETYSWNVTRKVQRNTQTHLKDTVLVYQEKFRRTRPQITQRSVKTETEQHKIPRDSTCTMRNILPGAGPLVESTPVEGAMVTTDDKMDAGGDDDMLPVI